MTSIPLTTYGAGRTPKADHPRKKVLLLPTPTLHTTTLTTSLHTSFTFFALQQKLVSIFISPLGPFASKRASEREEEEEEVEQEGSTQREREVEKGKKKKTKRRREGERERGKLDVDKDSALLHRHTHLIFIRSSISVFFSLFLFFVF